jgi:two-component sensor histidine kinase
MGDQARIIIDSDVGRQQMEGIRNAVAGEAARKAEQRKASFERAEGFEERQIPLVLGLGVAIILLVFTGFRAERTRSMAAVEAEQALALQEANERIELLARELNHRVKNLFSVILSIISLSARQTGSTKEIVESIRTRVHALSLAHNTSQGSMGSSMVGIGPIIAQTMEPYSDESGTKVRVRGPQLEIPTRMVTPMGMIIHELATNAAKYGSLSVPTGTVDIRWRIEPGDGERQEVSIRWTEEGGPAVAADDAKEDGGFGSQMMTLAASQLGGTISRDWQPSGLVAMLRFPLLEE